MGENETTDRLLHHLRQAAAVEDDLTPHLHEQRIRSRIGFGVKVAAVALVIVGGFILFFLFIAFEGRT
jgi:type VI protein secretion system component VasF